LRKCSGETYLKAVVADFGGGIIFCRFDFNTAILASYKPAIDFVLLNIHF
jgi:hypothetical protein